MDQDWLNAMQEQEDSEAESRKVEESQRNSIIQIQEQQIAEIIRRFEVKEMLTGIREQIWKAGIVTATSIGARLYLPFLWYKKRGHDEYGEIRLARIMEDEKSLDVIVVPTDRGSSVFEISVLRDARDSIETKANRLFLLQTQENTVAIDDQTNTRLKALLVRDCRFRKPVPYPPFVRESHEEVRRMLKEDKRLGKDTDHVSWALKRMEEIEKEFLQS